MRVHGYLTITDPDPPRASPGLREADTRTCRHCQTVLILKPGSGGTVYLIPPHADASDQRWKEIPGAWCGTCEAAICVPCAERGVCAPWLEQLDRMEARDRLRRAVAAG